MTQRQALHLTSPDVLFLRMQIAGGAAMLRVARNPRQLELGRDSDGAGIVYLPGNFTVNPHRSSTEGDQVSVGIEFENVTGEIAAQLGAFDDEGGIDGVKLTLIQANRAGLPDVRPEMELELEVQSVTASFPKALILAGRPSLLERPFPARRMDRKRCGHLFGGPGCGYDTSQPGALQSCSKFKTGPNGCEEHGDAEVAAGLARKHPERRLIFESIQRVSGVGVS